MEQKDYLSKQIDDLGKFLAILFGLLTNDTTSEKTTEKITHTEMELSKFGLNFNELASTNSKEFIEILTKKLNISPKNLPTLAEIFFEKGKLSENKGYFEKSLILFNHIMEKSETFDLEVKNKISVLTNLINNQKI